VTSSSYQKLFSLQDERISLPKDMASRSPRRARLVWCTCIKWVDEIKLLGENAATTSQMREFATRTMQQGVPSWRETTTRFH